MRGVGGGAGCIFRSSAEHVGSDSLGRGRSTPKVAEPRHEPRAQHAVALARSAKPGPGAKPGAHLIRMRPTSHPRRDTSRPTCPKRSPPRLKQPIFASSHRSGRRFEQQPDDSSPTQRSNMGGFATIGPRHAGDTPTEASYGRNSPRTCGLGRTSNPTTSAETPRTLPTPRAPFAQSTVHLPHATNPGRVSHPNATLNPPTPRRLAPHLPKAQSTSATTAHFHQFSPKWTTV